MTRFTPSALLILTTIAITTAACGEPENISNDASEADDASNDASETDDAVSDADIGSRDAAADCWAWITSDTSTCAPGCRTMYGDSGIAACEFTPGGFNPTEPIFCFPTGNGVTEAVECMRHDGETLYTTGGVNGAEFLDGWSACECG